MSDSRKIDTPTVIDETPDLLVLDSGPVVGWMDESDDHHPQSARGLRLLAAARTRLLIPVPIVFEVYKRLAYDTNPGLAARGLEYMLTALTVVYVVPDDLDRLVQVLALRPWWDGSLEDASVALLSLERRAPVWTYNYRDLQTFPNLQFWSPG